ncbi:pre-mRNA-splicing factor 38B-like [Amphibalanus amphitrite]|uniref:pre-mRNA-splicing factor 38B-like n=1 Tax=Amphibalanus amphitrite TaxID=1232801 RepID=UPI001C917C82|nr:pre-mRNA-splicing factor 38B-like [Amphibalanus amphitrite]
MRAEVCLSLALVTAVAASVPAGYYQQYWWTAAQRPGPYWEGDRLPTSDRSSETERLWRPDHEPRGGQTRHRHLTHGQAAALGGYLSSRRLADTHSPRYDSQGRQSGERGLEGWYATHGRQRQRDDSREDTRTLVRTQDRGDDRWNQRESQDSREHTWNQGRTQDSREDTRNQGRTQDSGEDRWSQGRKQDTRYYSWKHGRAENSGEDTRTPDRMQDSTEDTRTRGRAQYDRESIWSQGRTQDSREDPRNRSQESREDPQNQDRSQDGREDTQNQNISQDSKEDTRNQDRTRDSREDTRNQDRTQDSREEAGADGVGQNSASVEQHTSTDRGPYGGRYGGQTRYGGGQLGPERRGTAATRDDLRARQAPWWSDRLVSARQDRRWDAPRDYPPGARYFGRRGNYDDGQSEEDRRPGGRWAARDNSDEDSDERRHYWLG